MSTTSQSPPSGEGPPPAAEGPPRWTHRLTGFLVGRRTKWAVLAIWIVLLAALGPLAGKLADVEENDAAAWLPGQAESTKVVELQEKLRDDETIPALVVYEREGGITKADTAKAQKDAAAFAGLPGAEKAQGPFPSKDGKALQTVVPMTDDKVDKAVEKAREIAERGPPGLESHVTGPGGQAADLFEVFESIDGLLLLAAAGIVIVLLLLIYRSPVLWFIPVLSALFALAVSQSVVYLLAKYADQTVNGQSSGILTVLVFGVATDYALLLVARYREELHRHEDRHEAMAYALRQAGPAVLASASTVAVGLLCLLAADLNSTSGLGPVAATGVLVALAAMTTLLPALLVIFGRWVFWPVVPRFEPEAAAAGPTDEAAARHGVWYRVARAVAARPRALWAGVSVVLVAMSFSLVSLKAEGLSDAGQFTGKPDSVTGAAVLADHFPAGSGVPAEIVAKAAAAEDVRKAAAGTSGVAEVKESAKAAGYVQLDATLRDPADSEAARKTVERLREAVHDVPGGEALVGGTSATTHDMIEAADRDNKVIIPVVLVVVFLILVALLRALIAPLVMMATVVLSYLASLGVCGLIFQEVFGFEGTDAGFPLLAFIFLVALGVDYNIFLMHRVREETEVHGTREGLVRGLALTGGVITSAGLVLAGTFVALATLPLVNLAEMGFIVAFGVLVDTFVVRSLLLPALSYDIGPRIWSPGKLYRREKDRTDGDAGAEEKRLAPAR
ncbi:MMPL family transporter [Streptomyces sp. NPDC048172]|uniref:MMPL family transporter n=1 Tax=Streptomyces sp. NPDC048172 TaxID=3365505 RepID=UPI003710FEB3